MKKPKPNKLSLSIIIFFLSFLLYVPSLWYSFVWDDTSIIHTQINTMKDHGILWGGGGLYYRPLVAMSFLVDNALWKGNPAGFHLTNMVINSLNCVLVFILGTFLFKKKGLLPPLFCCPDISLSSRSCRFCGLDCRQD